MVELSRMETPSERLSLDAAPVMVCHVPGVRCTTRAIVRDIYLPSDMPNQGSTNRLLSSSDCSSSQYIGRDLSSPILLRTEFCVSERDCTALTGSPHTACATLRAVDFPIPLSTE